MEVFMERKKQSFDRQDQEQAESAIRLRAMQVKWPIPFNDSLDPLHDYAHDLGRLMSMPGRYDHLYGETVPNVNQVEFAETEEAKGIDQSIRVCQRRAEKPKPAGLSLPKNGNTRRNARSEFGLEEAP